MKIDFRMTPLVNVDGMNIFQAHENLVQDPATGLHMWCRGGAGAGFMITRPARFGVWQVRSRISVGLMNPSTKTCLLLWPNGTGWPPEIDFNESGDRDWSHQTIHYVQKPKMFHSAYEMGQTVWHTWEVEVQPEGGRSRCDGVDQAFKAASDGDGVGVVDWNLHVRTEPNGHDDVTHQDVRWVVVP